MTFETTELIGMIVMIVGVAGVWKPKKVLEKLPWLKEFIKRGKSDYSPETKIKMVGFGFVTLGFLLIFI